MNHQEFPDLVWRLEEILMQVDHLPGKSYLRHGGLICGRMK